MTITAEMIKAIREKTGAGMSDCKKALVESEENFDAAVDWLRKKGLAAAASKSSRVAADGLVGVASTNDGQTAAVVEVNAETDFVAKNQKFQDFVAKTTAASAKNAGISLEALLIADLGGRTVQESLTDLVAVIGENMVVRRVATLFVKNGVVATYAHSTVAPGMGKIGVLVALESDGDKAAIAEFGKRLAMHIAASHPKYLNIADVPEAVLQHEKEILLEQIKELDRPAAVLEKMVEGRVRKFYEDVVLNEQAYIMDNKKNVAAAVSEFAKEIGTPVTLSAFVRFALGDGIEKASANFAQEVNMLLT
ncbi:MAG: translation elongation factor Ts [Holosporales bacterium]|jgi:elongation factor Ts|nr:translation elongation factor Ts [Holosporales bacterium]